MDKQEAMEFYDGLSLHDKMRLMECISCDKDPETCGCDDNDENERGFCTKYERGRNNGLFKFTKSQRPDGRGC